MRGLDDALARIARRNELLERANAVRGDAQLPAPLAPGPQAATPTAAPTGPALSPVVEEVAEALRDVVRRNPGVYATVVVQEADTAWSVWIGEWDGTLRTRVSRLEPDLGDSTDPGEPAATTAAGESGAAAPAASAARPVIGPAIGPAMNDRVAGRIAALLRREAAREAARDPNRDTPR